MYKLSSYFLFLALSMVMACSKQPIRFTEKMAGEHTWHGRVYELWYGGTDYDEQFSEKIDVVDDETIVFKKAYVDTMKYIAGDKSNKRITFASYVYYGASTWYYDTVIYDYKKNVVFYNSKACGGGHVTATHFQTL